VQFDIWDFPGQIDFFEQNFDSEMIFGGCGALIFVIDAQVSGEEVHGLESMDGDVVLLSESTIL
jgi:hypothetical protein